MCHVEYQLKRVEVSPSTKKRAGTSWLNAAGAGLIGTGAALLVTQGFGLDSMFFLALGSAIYIGSFVTARRRIWRRRISS